MGDEFEPIPIKIEREDDDWLVDEPSTSHYVEPKIKREESGEENKFKCNHPNCKYSTNILQDFKNHEAIHTDGRPYKCDKCVRSFKAKSYLRNHRAKVHFKELGVEGKKHKREIFTCKELDCEYSSYYKANLKMHEVTHSKERPYQCDKCERTFKRSGELKNHLQYNHSEESPYQCDKCEKAFKTKGRLSRHKFTHINKKELKKLKCVKPDCEFTTFNKHSLNEHAAVHSNSTETPFQCDKCDCAFKIKRSLTQHQLIHRPKDDWYKCDACDYATSRRICLRNHQFKHTDANPIKCDLCVLTFKNETALCSHKKNIHSNGEKPFKCDKCDYRTRYSQCLKRHSFSHSKFKPFKCERCRYSCTTNLRRHHSLKHINEKEHKCEECGCSYDTEKYLKKHKLRHNEANRKFKCNLCPFRAFQKKSLSNHVSMMHNNKKSFKCETCERSFNLRSKLKAHQFVHSKTKNFMCHQCDYRTHYQYYLKHHQIFHRVSNEKSGKICDHCGLILRDELDSRTHQDAHRASFVPLRNVIVRHVKIELEDFVKREIN